MSGCRYSRPWTWCLLRRGSSWSGRARASRCLRDPLPPGCSDVRTVRSRPTGIRHSRQTSSSWLMSFDLNSDIERKNPFAAVEAFARAFPAWRASWRAGQVGSQRERARLSPPGRLGTDAAAARCRSSGRPHRANRAKPGLPRSPLAVWVQRRADLASSFRRSGTAVAGGDVFGNAGHHDRVLRQHGFHDGAQRLSSALLAGFGGFDTSFIQREGDRRGRRVAEPEVEAAAAWLRRLPRRTRTSALRIGARAPYGGPMQGIVHVRKHAARTSSGTQLVSDHSSASHQVRHAQGHPRANVGATCSSRGRGDASQAATQALAD